MANRRITLASVRKVMKSVTRKKYVYTSYVVRELCGSKMANNVELLRITRIKLNRLKNEGLTRNARYEDAFQRR